MSRTHCLFNVAKAEASVYDPWQFFAIKKETPNEYPDITDGPCS